MQSARHSAGFLLLRGISTLKHHYLLAELAELADLAEVGETGVWGITRGLCPHKRCKGDLSSSW